MSITVLVVGSGAREHAVAWKLSQNISESVRIVVAPGNDGMPADWIRWPVALADGVGAFRLLGEKAVEEKVDYVFIGPDNPLADGIVDVFTQLGLKTIGPTAHAAQIEASKSFAKDVMQSAGVPTARFWTVKDEKEAARVLESLDWDTSPWVIKADGLAFGKGVKICQTLLEALSTLSTLFKISGQLVIEEFLVGQEVSWMAFCDGESCSLLDPARDYKKLNNQDEGPNTGGMGAISPIPEILNLDSPWADRVREQVFLPVLREMKRRGAPFNGILYAGLMVDFRKDQFWVLEFNARLGDPETQVLMPRLKGDLLPWIRAIAENQLASLPKNVPFVTDHAVCVVAATPGYPEKPEMGQSLSLESQGSHFPGYFLGGVKRRGEKLVTSGGRVFSAVGMGPSSAQARSAAYESLASISFSGMHFRSDIGIGSTHDL